jgi:nitrate/nitrite-specific signal transduction histidine kinase
VRNTVASITSSREVEAILPLRLPAVTHRPGSSGRSNYIAAEATANAVKHANADHLQIVLVRTAGTLRLTITDDGAGGAALARGTGLQGLRDRADAAAGHLTLDSPDRGPTIVTADLPIPG